MNMQPAPTPARPGLFDPSVRADPYPLYAALRETSPVLPLMPGTWAFLRHADCAQVLRDPEFGKDFEGHVSPRRADAAPLDSFAVQGLARSMLTRDPPDHTRLRGLVVRAFTARRVDALRPRIAQIVDDLLDAVERDGEMDLIGAFAHRLPVIVICDMLGVPESDRDRFLGTYRVGGRLLDPVPLSAEELAHADDAAREMRDYWESLFDRRAADPGDDLISALMAVEDAHDGRLTRDELASNINLLFAAGHETTTNLIGNGMIAFARFPDQWRRLVAHPSLAAGAAEEMLRFDSPVQLTGRKVFRDCEVGGHALKRGEHVTCVIGAANRDPALYDDPEAVDITRKGIRLLSFGGGIHFCLGAQLARTEAEIAFRRLAERLPGIRIDPDAIEWRESITLRGAKRIPASW